MSVPNVSVPLEIQSIELKKAALVFRAVNHKLRQQMLQLIHKKDRLKVTDIFVKLRMEQSIVSQHLAILRSAGIVNTQREGKMIFYSVNYDRLEQMHKIAAELLKDQYMFAEHFSP